MADARRFLIFISWYLLTANTTFAYTRQDTLRGSNGAGRYWWDVQRYELDVFFDTAGKSISGRNIVSLKLSSMPGDSLQIDIQQPLEVDSVLHNGRQLVFAIEGNVCWVKGNFNTWSVNSSHAVVVYYHGVPRPAKAPPWDGGVIWTKDSLGKPWIAVACQGLGASVWWPCKDYQGDEPDSGMTVALHVPKGMKAISNGRLLWQNRDDKNDGYCWEIQNPVNSYNTTFYIGDYVSWTDTMKGEKRTLGLSFYVLRQNEDTARKQFAVTKQMLHCFEHWLGPYPFYEDGYKLVDAPFLGMEHQSGIAYGNLYKMGYLGRDRSNTGVGMLFDYIVIHESGHEWFGNNITAKDIADNWIHEGFTTYTETLFAEWIAGKEKAFTYQKGERHNIMNATPIVGDYGVNDDGSPDKYDKGSTIVHMIRLQIGDDEKFRQLLRGLNKTFYHQTVTTAEVEGYIIKTTGLDLKAFFDQYLRTIKIPELEWYVKKKQLYYRFNNTVDGFTLPIAVSSGKKKAVLKPTGEWQTVSWRRAYNLDVSDDYLITVK